MTKVFVLIGFFSLVSSVQTPVKTKYKVGVVKKQQSPGKSSVGRSRHLTQSQLLQGAWAECSDCNFDFSLEGNRVIFYDPGTDGKQETVHWKVSNNKLSFFYKGGIVVTDVIIKLDKDSLVLFTNNKRAGVVGYSRFVRLK